MGNACTRAWSWVAGISDLWVRRRPADTMTNFESMWLKGYAGTVEVSRVSGMYVVLAGDHGAFHSLERYKTVLKIVTVLYTKHWHFSYSQLLKSPLLQWPGTNFCSTLASGSLERHSRSELCLRTTTIQSDQHQTYQEEKHQLFRCIEC